MDQHLQRRQSLHEDGTPQILLITPSGKNLGHHLTLSIDTLNYKEKSYFCQLSNLEELIISQFRSSPHIKH